MDNWPHLASERAAITGRTEEMFEATAAAKQGDARPWWEAPWFLALVVLATMIPLLYPPIPPLVDLFGHMGRYRVELDLDQSPWLQQYFDYHWAAIGNLGVDILVLLLAPVMGLEPAVKLIVLADPAADGHRASCGWRAKCMGGSRRRAFFALPFIYGYPFLFGFVNFTLSVAFAFLAIRPVAGARPARADRRCAMAVRADLARRLLHPYLRLGPAGPDVLFGRGGAAARPRAQPGGAPGFEAALHTSVMALPLARSCSSGAARRTAARPIGWFEWKMKWRWIYSALRDRWKWFDIWLAGRRRRGVRLSRSSAAS